MFLTATNIGFYLRDIGVSAAEDVTDENFIVVEVGRRNRNFLVLRPRSSSLFVKQVPVVHPETVSSFLREAACAQVASEMGDAMLRAVMPRLRRYDETRHILVYDLFGEAETLVEIAARTGAAPVAYARQLGRTLAGYHAETARAGALVSVAAALTGEPPWILSIPEDAESVMPRMSDGCRQVVTIIRATPELYEGLVALRRGWRHICLTHGDLKADNILFTDRSGEEPELHLIDWELADVGDPLWDVASVLECFLQLWFLKLPAELIANPLDAAPSGRPNLTAVWEPAKAFWTAYLVGGGLAVRPIDSVLVHVGRLIGARLALLAFELLPAAPSITPLAAFVLQLARYFFLARGPRLATSSE
jgi:hypothetical protein